SPACGLSQRSPTARWQIGRFEGGFSLNTLPKIDVGNQLCMKAAAWVLSSTRGAAPGQATFAPRMTMPLPMSVPSVAARAGGDAASTTKTAAAAAVGATRGRTRKGWAPINVRYQCPALG